jgi:hypothetical protein
MFSGYVDSHNMSAPLVVIGKDQYLVMAINHGKCNGIFSNNDPTALTMVQHKCGGSGDEFPSAKGVLTWHQRELGGAANQLKDISP